MLITILVRDQKLYVINIKGYNSRKLIKSKTNAIFKQLEVSSIYDIQIEKLVRYSTFEIHKEVCSIFDIQIEKLV